MVTSTDNRVTIGQMELSLAILPVSLSTSQFGVGPSCISLKCSVQGIFWVEAFALFTAIQFKIWCNLRCSLNVVQLFVASSVCGGFCGVYPAVQFCVEGQT